MEPKTAATTRSPSGFDLSSPTAEHRRRLEAALPPEEREVLLQHETVVYSWLGRMESEDPMISGRFCGLIGALCLLIGFGGCATARVNNLTSASLVQQPSIQTFADPETDFSKYRTFSVFPYSVINKNKQVNPIMEKQLLFFLRNAFEVKGYKFVQLDGHPDFLATIYAESQYEEHFVPPQTVVLPRYIPGQTITTFGTTSGSFNFNTFGNYSTYGWGNYSGSSTSTTYVPGTWTTQTYTRSGYTVGYNYPIVSIQVFDTKTLKGVWNGIGVGTSRNPDVRVSGQLVALNILKQYPNVPTEVIRKRFENRGRAGVSVVIMTNDGNNYYPVIAQVEENSAAARAGIELYDMIEAIDGTPMVNKSYSDVLRIGLREPGSHVRVTIRRLSETRTLEITE